MDIKKYIIPVMIGAIIGASLSGVLGYLMSFEIMIKTIMQSSSTLKVFLGAGKAGRSVGRSTVGRPQRMTIIIDPITIIKGVLRNYNRNRGLTRKSYRRDFSP